jgi:hypothetical protein
MTKIRNISKSQDNGNRCSGHRNVAAYFMALMILFGCLSLGLNWHISRESMTNLNRLQGSLMDSFSNGISTITTKQQVMDTADKIVHGVHQDKGHELAGLNCDAYGGPSQEVAAEMVYWEDIPSDAAHISPFKKTSGPRQYLTFEPDNGGW